VLVAAMAWLRHLRAGTAGDGLSGFALRFIAWSSPLFLLWLSLAEGYVRLNLQLVNLLVGLWGRRAPVPAELGLYPHTFNTFHFVAFASLVLATASLGWKEKARSLASGLALLAGAQFLFRLHQVLFLELHARSALLPFVALLIINQWVLPFAFWLALVSRELFGRKEGRFSGSRCAGTCR